MLVFKKKFFIFDSHIDRDDPVGLHLLYVQAREAIMSGEHPLQRSEAIQLASLQCQILDGPYIAERHNKPGFFE